MKKLKLKDKDKISKVELKKLTGDYETGPNPCPPGYKWSNEFKKCIPDPG